MDAGMTVEQAVEAGLASKSLLQYRDVVPPPAGAPPPNITEAWDPHSGERRSKETGRLIQGDVHDPSQAVHGQAAGGSSGSGRYAPAADRPPAESMQFGEEVGRNAISKISAQEFNVAWATGDYYKALGIQASASQETVKQAFRKASLYVHPDKCPDPTKREMWSRRFLALQRVHDTLVNPVTRAQYDRMV